MLNEVRISNFKAKLKEWGLNKNLKSSEMKVLLAKREKLKQDRHVYTVFMYHDMDLGQRLDTFSKRPSTKLEPIASSSNRMLPSKVPSMRRMV